jgi:hypothetical protein
MADRLSYVTSNELPTPSGTQLNPTENVVGERTANDPAQEETPLIGVLNVQVIVDGIGVGTSWVSAQTQHVVPPIGNANPWGHTEGPHPQPPMSQASKQAIA